MKPALHPAERQRLAALGEYAIIDTAPEPEFDDIVSVVSAICQTPVSLISLVEADRQWFKAGVGTDLTETPLESSICAHAILQPDLFVIPDTTKDDRFRDNPLVAGDPHVRFYAGAILETSDGLPLGTLCVLDYKPRVLDENQRALLGVMARQVMKLLELRRLHAREHAARLRAESLAKENETLAREGDHRVMNSLQLVSAVLGLQLRSATNADAKAQLEAARNRVHAIATVHRQLHLAGSLEEIEIGAFLARLSEGLKENAPASVTALHVRADSMHLRSDLASALGLIVAELVANAYKHAYPDGRQGEITVEFAALASGWRLRVSDHGIGLPIGFDVADSRGVGMRVVSALVRRLDAKLEVTFGTPGSAFIVSWNPPSETQTARPAARTGGGPD